MAPKTRRKRLSLNVMLLLQLWRVQRQDDTDIPGKSIVGVRTPRCLAARSHGFVATVAERPLKISSSGCAGLPGVAADEAAVAAQQAAAQQIAMQPVAARLDENCWRNVFQHLDPIALGVLREPLNPSFYFCLG
jgi:hypothetical protein